MTGKAVRVNVGATAVSGVYFDGRSSRDHPATVTLTEQGVTLNVPDLNVTRTWPLPEVSVDPAIPGVRRVVKFPDGGRYETTDDAALGAWERRVGRNRALSGVRWLESRWTAALGALALAVAAVAAFIVFGIPALATQAAAVTPRSVLATFDRETLKVLNSGTYVGATKLSAARQAQLQREFREVAAWAGGGYAYTLLLRDGEPGGPDSFGIGPNAFALPGGTVVMTDQLVALANSDRELMGVLAHETGHVTHRHGLAGVYQGLGLTLVSTVITGDLVSASTFAAAVPAALLRGGYSRAAETQADEVSGRFMLERYRTTRPLQDILARLESQLGDGKDAGDSKPSVFDLLRSHPGTAQRIEHLRAIERAALP
ncbi:M48 family metallopeptidase [Deinococcus sp.]|uniref:M48 family metallopeptidase n=1 Tax=Deinococcus sp. TaxID=47478 RepID=UPI002869B0E0|nr:M48 family metallopeptidase [Deinococcus sp.]